MYRRHSERAKDSPAEGSYGKVVLYGWRKSLCSPTIGLTERGFSITEAQANHLHGCISTQTKVLKFCPSRPFPPSAWLPYRGLSD